MLTKYKNRRAAGKILATHLLQYKNQPQGIILALPRGGVPVAYEIAKELSLALDVWVVRKLGVPLQEELALGAIGMTGEVYLDQQLIENFKISHEMIASLVAQESLECQRRHAVYREDLALPDLKNKTVIIVDDGIATGASMRVAVMGLQACHPAKIVIAVPVMDETELKNIMLIADEVVCPLLPTHLNAVGAWFEDFPQTEDEEVRTLLHEARTLS